MRYLITGGSGYIGSRLTEILGARDETEQIVNLDVRPPARPQPKTTFVRGRRARLRGDSGPARAPRARRARPPRLPAQPDPRRGADVRHRRQRHRGGAARRGRGGHPAGARHLLGDRLRRLPRQPKADRRGLAGPRPARLLLRARQGRGGPALPALGARAPRPGDDDRPALHRVRPERRQLHRRELGRSRRSCRSWTASTRSSSSSTRTTS